MEVSWIFILVSAFTLLPQETTQYVFGPLRVIKESAVLRESVSLEMRADSDSDLMDSDKTPKSSSQSQERTSDRPAIELSSQQRGMMPRRPGTQEEKQQYQQHHGLLPWEHVHSSNVPMGYLPWAIEHLRRPTESGSQNYEYFPVPQPSKVGTQQEPKHTCACGCMRDNHQLHGPLPWEVEMKQTSPQGRVKEPRKPPWNLLWENDDDDDDKDETVTESATKISQKPRKEVSGDTETSKEDEADVPVKIPVGGVVYSDEVSSLDDHIGFGPSIDSAITPPRPSQNNEEDKEMEMENVELTELPRIPVQVEDRNLRRPIGSFPQQRPSFSQERVKEVEIEKVPLMELPRRPLQKEEEERYPYFHPPTEMFDQHRPSFGPDERIVETEAGRTPLRDIPESLYRNQERQHFWNAQPEHWRFLNSDPRNFYPTISYPFSSYNTQSGYGRRHIAPGFESQSRSKRQAGVTLRPPTMPSALPSSMPDFRQDRYNPPFSFSPNEKLFPMGPHTPRYISDQGQKEDTPFVFDRPFHYPLRPHMPGSNVVFDRQPQALPSAPKPDFTPDSQIQQNWNPGSGRPLYPPTSGMPWFTDKPTSIQKPPPLTRPGNRPIPAPPRNMGALSFMGRPVTVTQSVAPPRPVMAEGPTAGTPPAAAVAGENMGAQSFMGRPVTVTQSVASPRPVIAEGPTAATPPAAAVAGEVEEPSAVVDPPSRSVPRPLAPEPWDGRQMEGCNCPRTYEFNPVCGTDRITYTNLGRMKCAIHCGRNVEVLHHGACINL